ncbi:hypothetical protein BCR42DRAFT_364117 [Absidia repens]|uniref:Arrestin C-terminal-like domain-containing protein n=1 Tax=Absidia repens TaxID=90262 RepID=A0A1X2J1M0_9FUNG|nr:hypothetical protein BCR42DRAFT_364117 [Absidia repens]
MGFSGTVVNIDLENDHLIMHGNANESPGCVLRGVLNLHLKQPTKVKSIILTLTGTIQISWTQPLAHGHEQFFRAEKTVVSHQWIFLRPQYARSHQLSSGNHSYEFECFMAGDLPESIRVAQFYFCQYQLKATIQRPHFLPKYACRRLVHVTRQQLHPAISSFPGGAMMEPVTITQRWVDQLDYRISLPSKLYHHGNVMPVTLRLQPLVPGLFVRQLTCTFKEYASCKPVNGWFGGRTRSHRKILYYVRKGQSSITALSSSDPWCIHLAIPVPETLDDIQCDTYSDSVRVRHKLKFVISIANAGGSSLVELRAVLPVVIQAKASALLPSYEQCHDGQSFPYDPALMVALLRRNEQQQQQQQQQREEEEDQRRQNSSSQQSLSTQQQQQQQQRRRRLLHHRRMSCSIDHDIQQQRGTEVPATDSSPTTTNSNSNSSNNTTTPTSERGYGRRFAFHRMSLPLPLPSFSQHHPSHHVLPAPASNDIIPTLSRLPTYEEIHCH